jgi:hypothetical protein
VTRKFWVIALTAWLILWGLLAVTNFRFDASNLIMGLLAIVAGVLLVLDK